MNIGSNNLKFMKRKPSQPKVQINDKNISTKHMGMWFEYDVNMNIHTLAVQPKI